VDRQDVRSELQMASLLQVQNRSRSRLQLRNARAFDLKSLELGNPIGNVAEGVGPFSVSARGDVAFLNTNRSRGGTLVWVDRTGNTKSAITDRPVQNPRLSRDGRSVAVIIEGDVWRYDLDGRPPQRLTFDGKHLSPLWTPNGTQVISEAGDGTLVAVLADGSSNTPEQASPRSHFHPHGWTRDGQIVAVQLLYGNVLDLVRFFPKSTGQIEIVLATPAEEGLDASMSPDGRWLAYTSNETGRNEIYLRAISGRLRRIGLTQPPSRSSWTGRLDCVLRRPTRLSP
jgi:eukaryotic-like serine/threonine-protein kinase